jgi:hypothetical protein
MSTTHDCLLVGSASVWSSTVALLFQLASHPRVGLIDMGIGNACLSTQRCRRLPGSGRRMSYPAVPRRYLAG